MGVLLKLLLVVAASLAIASGVTAIVNNFMSKLPEYGTSIGSDSISLLIFVTFVVAFLASAVPLSMSIVDWRDGKKRGVSAGKGRPAPAKPKDAKAAADVKSSEKSADKEEPPAKPEKDKAAEKEKDKPAEEDKAKVPPEEEKTAESPPEAEDASEEKDGAEAEKAVDPMESFRMVMIGS